MDAPSRRLGRGLSGLIGQPVAVQASAVPVAAESGLGLQRVDVGRVRPNPFQPRQVFDEAELSGLASSIKQQGIMQPLVARTAADGMLELIAGERRWRAAQRAGLAQVPVVVVEIDDQQAAAWALVENIQRVELGTIEKARGYRRLNDQFKMTHLEISQAVGEDRSIVSNYIRILDLEFEIQDLVENKSLTFGHCKVLLSLEPGPARVMLARRAAEEGASVRGLERMIEEYRARAVAVSGEMVPEPKAPGSGGDAGGKFSPSLLARAQINDLEKQISEQLGTRVRIAAKAGSGTGAGTMTIAFYTHEQFEGLLERMSVRLNQG